MERTEACAGPMGRVVSDQLLRDGKCVSLPFCFIDI